ncbi:RraA family protein [Pseudoprimorskyibacter insulae]|uniref:Putative 4-hydroxy-4-methyl-2-oxoglutarate aldolase n=1 Tax=Pseudoprimorskyibacter insulae TaxID=1695997 RepID=A0A2R8B0E6_9RHOB|nr:RraA family protein [Pseudoprimorskyibacter insulae]SPF81765.1 4-hydroxy-4-methyl-2-oxoglutarate aldolase/4-carboxy-4-hydroxy-2-oxoadipate aldolase [Pseudoprimorskyibacter insulae]
MPAGFRVLNRTQTAPKALVEAFAKLPVANVSDSMARVTAAGPTLRPMHSSGTMAGVALTVKTRPGDNLMLHKAIDMAVPGDVIVCDAGGDLTNALMGELMLAYAMKKGVAGFVLNGAIRDFDFFRSFNLPTWAVGVTHRGPYKDGPGEVNVPVSLGGMVIHPGDIVIGDSDGVHCVPLAEAEAVLAQTQAKSAAEIKQMAAIEAGTNDRTWVDRALKERGCEMPE